MAHLQAVMYVLLFVAVRRHSLLEVGRESGEYPPVYTLNGGDMCRIEEI